MPSIVRASLSIVACWFAFAAVACGSEAPTASDEGNLTEPSTKGVAEREENDLLLDAMIDAGAPVVGEHGGSDPGSTRRLDRIICTTLYVPQCFTAIDGTVKEIFASGGDKQVDLARLLDKYGVPSPTDDPNLAFRAPKKLDGVECTFNFGVGTYCSYEEPSNAPVDGEDEIEPKRGFEERKENDLALDALVDAEAPVVGEHGGSDPGSTRRVDRLVCATIHVPQCFAWYGSTKREVFAESNQVVDLARLLDAYGKKAEGLSGVLATRQPKELRELECTFNFGVGTFCGFR